LVGKARRKSTGFGGENNKGKRVVVALSVAVLGTEYRVLKMAKFERGAIFLSHIS